MTPLELLDMLRNLVTNGVEVPLAAFKSSCEVDATPEVNAPAQVLSHLQALDGVIVHSTTTVDSVTLVIDAVDYFTALSVRESWVFLISDGDISRVIACWGFRSQQREPLGRREVDPYLRGFGFRFAQPDDEQLVLSATQSVSRELERSVEFSVVDVLINDDLVYVPYTWIGCCGFLVVRESGNAVLLGSGINVPIHVWAFYRGFADGETGPERLNDLVITSIRDETATRRTLQKCFRILPSLDTLPVRVRSVDLYFSRPALWEAELRGFFHFSIEPPTEAA